MIVRNETSHLAGASIHLCLCQLHLIFITILAPLSTEASWTMHLCSIAVLQQEGPLFQLGTYGLAVGLYEPAVLTCNPFITPT